MTPSKISSPLTDQEESLGEELRFCKTCGTSHHIGEFYKTSRMVKSRKIYVQFTCRKKARIAAKLYIERNPDKRKESSKRANLKARYGISFETYTSMLMTQSGQCAGCGSPPKIGRALNVDHDHSTGKIRGLLCDGCNLAIGIVKDSSSLLLRLAQYLDQHG